MPDAQQPAPDGDFDAVVVGAGFAGLYAVYKLTRMGFRVRAFVAAMRIGSDSAILAFLNAHFASSQLAARPASDRLPNFRRLAASLRDARVVRVMASTPTTIQVDLVGTAGAHLLMEFICEPQDPHRLLDWRRLD